MEAISAPARILWIHRRKVTITKGTWKFECPLPLHWRGSGHRRRGRRLYSNPEFRRRETGSITGTGSRWKNHRATANPIAAYQTCTSFI